MFSPTRHFDVDTMVARWVNKRKFSRLNNECHEKGKEKTKETL